MISPDLLDDTMSLTSLREDGLFTGEEITLKYRPDRIKSLTVLVEADEISGDEENSFDASVIESKPSLTRINSPCSQLEESLDRMPESRDDMVEEETGDEGVNAILIEEHDAPITSTESHVGHFIPPSQPQLPLSPESKAKQVRFSFKRNIKMQMNRAAIKVKSMLSNGKAGGTSLTEITTETNHAYDDDDGCDHALPTPRAAETIEEAASQHFEEAEHSSSSAAASPVNNDATCLSDTTRIEHTKPACFDTVTEDENISSQAPTPTIANVESHNSSTDYTAHVPQQLESKPSVEFDQIDPNYEGPYDDNKSFVTYSTGDFDMSQMYSRSWSTLAPTVTSKTSKLFAPRKFGKSRSERSRTSLSSKQDRVIIMSSSFNTEKDQGCTEDNIMVVQVSDMGVQNKKDESFSLDGLSFVNSVVGDDRSFVEDY